MRPLQKRAYTYKELEEILRDRRFVDYFNQSQNEYRIRIVAGAYQVIKDKRIELDFRGKGDAGFSPLKQKISNAITDKITEYEKGKRKLEYKRSLVTTREASLDAIKKEAPQDSVLEKSIEFAKTKFSRLKINGVLFNFVRPTHSRGYTTRLEQEELERNLYIELAASYLRKAMEELPGDEGVKVRKIKHLETDVVISYNSRKKILDIKHELSRNEIDSFFQTCINVFSSKEEMAKTRREFLDRYPNLRREDGEATNIPETISINGEKFDFYKYLQSFLDETNIEKFRELKNELEVLMVFCGAFLKIKTSRLDEINLGSTNIKITHNSIAADNLQNLEVFNGIDIAIANQLLTRRVEAPAGYFSSAYRERPPMPARKEVDFSIARRSSSAEPRSVTIKDDSPSTQATASSQTMTSPHEASPPPTSRKLEFDMHGVKLRPEHVHTRLESKVVIGKRSMIKGFDKSNEVFSVAKTPGRVVETNLFSPEERGLVRRIDGRMTRAYGKPLSNRQSTPFKA